MRKLFTKVAIVLVITSSATPLVACSFNFYVNRAAAAIARSFANQTSAVLKSLVMSKVIDSDTVSTNDDIMKQTKNSSIVNASGGQTINNWSEFANNWGVNGKIDINGFDVNNYFKGTGTGTLTKNINKRRAISDSFNTAGQIRLLTSLNNPVLYNLAIDLKAPIYGQIVEFIKTLQGDLKDKPATLQLLINLINNYSTDFIPAISRLIDNLVDGDWDTTGQKTPNNFKELTNFMTGWKDKDNKPYSEWNNGSSWTIPKPIIYPSYQGRPVDTWVPKKDYDLYRGGTLINYLFWKMSSDNKIYKTGQKIGSFRYLGGILTDYYSIVGGSFDNVGFEKDIMQYAPYILTNPIYPLLIIEGIIPIIKKWLLEMPDITLGVKHLTVGDIPTNQITQSFNLLDVAKTIKNLVNNPEQLKTIIKCLLGGSTLSTLGFDTFAYDIKMNVFPGFAVFPIGGVIHAGGFDANSLIDTLIGFLTSKTVKNMIDNIVSIINQLGKQYTNATHIDIDLIKTKLFLLNSSNGLLTKLTTAMISLKYIIKNNDPIQDSAIEQLYVNLGGNIPGNNYSIFTRDMPIDILQKTMVDQNSELSKILNLLLGTTDTDKKLGITDIVTHFNNQWIKTNYEDYFDAFNVRLGHTYNISMQNKTIDNIEIINLKYNFNYRIGATTYRFIITISDNEDLNSFQGIRNFKLKTITFIN